MKLSKKTLMTAIITLGVAACTVPAASAAEISEISLNEVNAISLDRVKTSEIEITDISINEIGTLNIVPASEVSLSEQAATAITTLEISQKKVNDITPYKLSANSGRLVATIKPDYKSAASYALVESGRMTEEDQIKYEEILRDMALEKMRESLGLKGEVNNTLKILNSN